MLSNLTINKTIGRLGNKRSFWRLYTARLRHHQFQEFLLYLSSSGYLELLIKILKDNMAFVDLITFYSLWIKILEYKDHEEKAQFIRELGVIEENKIIARYDGWRYTFSDVTIEALSILKQISEIYLYKGSGKEVDSERAINLIYLPKEYIGEYLIHNRSIEEIELLWNFIMENISDVVARELEKGIFAYLGMKGDIKTLNKFIPFLRNTWIDFGDIAASYATPAVSEQLKQLFYNLNKDHPGEYIWGYPSDSIQTSLETLENASIEDTIDFLDNVNMGAFPDIYFPFIDNIPLSRMSLDRKQILYDEMMLSFDEYGYTRTAQICRDRKLI